MKTLGAIVKDTSRELYIVSASETVGATVRYMTDRNIGAVIIVEGERVVGLFSERDLMKRVVAAGLDPEKTRVRDVMTTELIMGGPDETYEEAIQRMHSARCRHLPVLEGERFLGLISLRDLLEVDAVEKAEEIRMLNTYIHYVPPGISRRH